MEERPYITLEKLKAGKVIEVNGIKLKMIKGELKENDLYVAERNAGPKFLTVKEITDGYIIPYESAYFYDIRECIKVEMI